MVMRVNETVTYGRIPYWKHNGHTARAVERIDYEDGTADVHLLCECAARWNFALGVDHSEEAPEG